MSTFSLGTGAATDGNQVGVFTVKNAHVRNKPGVVVSIEGLASSETASLWYQAGDEWVEATEGGNQVVFDATVGSKLILGTGTYAFTKDATTADPTVRLHLD
jgi:hypothetical protein